MAPEVIACDENPDATYDYRVRVERSECVLVDMFPHPPGLLNGNVCCVAERSVVLWHHCDRDGRGRAA